MDKESDLDILKNKKLSNNDDEIVDSIINELNESENKQNMPQVGCPRVGCSGWDIGVGAPGGMHRVGASG